MHGCPMLRLKLVICFKCVWRILFSAEHRWHDSIETEFSRVAADDATYNCENDLPLFGFRLNLTILQTFMVSKIKN